MDEPTGRRFRFEDSRQEHIHRRLSLIGPGPQDFYQDACQLMQGEIGLQAVTHLVAHCLREVESALCQVLRPMSKRPVLETEGHVGKIQAIIEAIGIKDEVVGREWLAIARGKGNAARAHRRDLDPPRTRDEEFQEYWDKSNLIFDVVLDRIETLYGNFLQTVDEILLEPEPNCGASRLRKEVPNNPIVLQHVFAGLMDPRWIGPLRIQRFFAYPPDPESSAEGVRYYTWPASQCLARVAPLAPLEVAEVLNGLPGTDNPLVRRDCMHAACHLAPASIKPWLAGTRAWLGTQEYLQLGVPEEAARLAVHLAASGARDEAIDWMREVLRLSVRERSGKDTEGRSARLPPEPQARFDQYSYEQILKEQASALVEGAGLDGFTMLCDLLESAVVLSLREGSGARPHDHSYIWRIAVEESDPNGHRSPKGALVSAVRDAARLLVDRELAGLHALIDEMESREWKIFQRLALDLLRHFPEEGAKLVAERLTDPATMLDVETRHEYHLLLQSCFSRLDVEDQEQILDIIDEGPGGGEVDPVQIALWKRDRLAAIRDDLQGEWRERYQVLVREHGEPVRPGFPFFIETCWEGPRSPRSVEELRGMPVAELVGYLAASSPSTHKEQVEEEGLSWAVQKLVGDSPEPYASAAALFRGLRPPFVRGLLEGLGQAVRNGKSFIWAPVLELCLWVVQQDRVIPGYSGRYATEDPGWVWTRKAIAHLLETGLVPGACRLPFGLRDCVWEVLEPVTRDEDPTPEEEVAHGGSNMEPATLSINTIRGVAMHAAVRYGLWVHSCLEELEDEGTPSLTLAVMPELRSVLEEHLDIEKDPTLAIRSVYGQWFPFLATLDAQWAEGVASAVFPEGEGQERYLNAAWCAYLSFNRPWQRAFDMLESHYQRACGRIGKHPPESRELRDADRHLVEHLMVLYWQGTLPLDDPTGTMAKFFAVAPVASRSYAIEYIGRSLYQTEGALPESCRILLEQLWTVRLEAAKTAQPEEVLHFGWWCASKKFDESWALEQLEQVLHLVHTAEPDHLVAEHLDDVFGESPLQTIKCLELLVAGAGADLSIHGWLKQAESLLVKAASHEEQAVRDTGTRVAHRLVAKGFTQFRRFIV